MTRTPSIQSIKIGILPVALCVWIYIQNIHWDFCLIISGSHNRETRNTVSFQICSEQSITWKYLCDCRGKDWSTICIKVNRCHNQSFWSLYFTTNTLKLCLFFLDLYKEMAHKSPYNIPLLWILSLIVATGNNIEKEIHMHLKKLDFFSLINAENIKNDEVSALDTGEILFIRQSKLPRTVV